VIIFQNYPEATGDDVAKVERSVTIKIVRQSNLKRADEGGYVTPTLEEIAGFDVLVSSTPVDDYRFLKTAEDRLYKVNKVARASTPVTALYIANQNNEPAFVFPVKPEIYEPTQWLMGYAMEGYAATSRWAGFKQRLAGRLATSW
jgi:hypothetical protein